MSTDKTMNLARVIKDFWWECEAGTKPTEGQSGEPSGGDHALASAIIAAGYQPAKESVPQFIFEMFYTDWSDDPYYHRDWSGAKRIEVVAPDRQEAVAKAKVALGNPPSHRVWGFQIKSIKDVLIPTEENK